ncbi:MAG: 50S ribosomal protein L23 [Bacillota bacterium]|uniref:50S ribosomal protein L23 n=1 Tax=unclassified Carboxydocella TaxID=2685367 RepID=UPI0009AF1C69|nr:MULTISPECIES: 50S ribosomal protein L23 [unclassified Carboxydocella]AVX32209.1 LSU ribosomal protein L23P [Carboxydocella thermautotrophica]GAW27563.1 50S ribosomal protein L23 [Carboxydocella sp. ULO1]GAW30929.1 50S ribosomal protein L23 [Carboxydocella sp. JDF658]
MRSYQDVLIRPVVSEKSMALLAENKYTFLVNPAANKIEIKHAVEKAFGVKVVDVWTMNIKGKTKRVGRTVGKTPDKKKAIVKLAEGHKIELFEGV